MHSEFVLRLMAQPEKALEITHEYATWCAKRANPENVPSFEQFLGMTHDNHSCPKLFAWIRESMEQTDPEPQEGSTEEGGRYLIFVSKVASYLQYTDDLDKGQVQEGAMLEWTDTITGLLLDTSKEWTVDCSGCRGTNLYLKAPKGYGFYPEDITGIEAVLARYTEEQAVLSCSEAADSLMSKAIKVRLTHDLHRDEVLPELMESLAACPLRILPDIEDRLQQARKDG